MKITLFALLVVLISVPLAGCHKGAEYHVKMAGPARLSGGWTLAQSRDRMVTIGVPSGWRYGVDRMGDSLKDMLGSIETPNSAGGQEVQQMAENMNKQDAAAEEKGLAELEKKGIVLNVINSSKPIPGEARTRFYVKKIHADSPVQWMEAAQAERKHYAFPPKPTEIDLPIGKAWKLSASDNLRDGATLHQISYVVVDGSDLYTLRFVTEESLETIKSIAEDVAKTWRITPAKS